MLILTETTDKLQIVLTAAKTANDMQCYSAWRDIGATTFVAGRTIVDSNGVTDVDLVAAPLSSIQRAIDYLSIYNNDTALKTVIVKIDANGTEKILWKQDVAAGGVLEYTTQLGWIYSAPSPQGYAINVQALTSSPADTTPFYFGTSPATITTTAGQRKIYIRKPGTLKIAEIHSYAGTAGTAENVSMYVRVNNTTDYLIQTVGAAANERVFTNSALSIPLAAGDYIEIKCIPPIWATNPLTFICGGYVYIE
jgi:hypothetical protein